MHVTKTLKLLLKAHGMQIVRHRKHLVYKNNDGVTFVKACTPSDSRFSEVKALADLKRALGVSRPVPNPPTERESKRVCRQQPIVSKPAEFTGKARAGTLLESQLASAFAHDPAMERFYMKRRLERGWRSTTLRVRELSKMEYVGYPALTYPSNHWHRMKCTIRRNLRLT